VPTLSDTSIQTISETVERLVKIMFEYWKHTYSGGEDAYKGTQK
jgi:hypothetical protein